MIFGLLYKKEECASNFENIIGRMQVLSGNKGERTFQLLQPGMDISENKRITDLVNTADKLGISLKMIPVDSNNLKDFVSQFDASIPTALVIYEKRTLKSDIKTLYELLISHNITASKNINMRFG